MPDHFEARRDVGQDLGDAFTDNAQICAAAGFAGVLRHVHDVAAWQCGRQCAALFLLLRRSLDVRCWWLGRLRYWRFGFGLRCFRFLQRQLELLDRPFDALGTGAKLLTAQFGQLRLEFLDRQLRDDETVLGCGQLGVFGEQQPLQFDDVIRELIGGKWHAPYSTCFAWRDTGVMSSRSTGLSRQRRLPSWARRAPFEPLKQHR